MAWNTGFRRRKNNGCGCALFPLFVIFVAVMMMRSHWRSTPSGGGGAGGVLPPPTAPARPDEVAEIQKLLKPAPGAAERRDGIAALILVDVSGSMNESVTDAGGSRRPKIEIARRAAAELVNQTERFAKEHPDRTVLLGIKEFSSQPGRPASRTVVPLGKPDAAAAHAAISRMSADGGTPIGDAVIEAKRELDAAGLRKSHILVVTDGENTAGRDPGEVAKALATLPVEEAASLYFVAFDIDAAKFSRVREAGVGVLGAADENELRSTLDFLLSGKILLEE